VAEENPGLYQAIFRHVQPGADSDELDGVIHALPLWRSRSNYRCFAIMHIPEHSTMPRSKTATPKKADAALRDMTGAFSTIIESVGEDLKRDGLLKTPERAAKAFQFITRGYTQSLKEIINGALFDSDSNEMVIVKDIELYSMCEHHLLPFIGKCHVAYIPTGKVLGLSKIARIVDMYARRLQIQEGLTSQIAKTIQQVTGASGVGVIIEAKHLCMMMRGVEKQNSLMKTSAMLGEFRSNEVTRKEFLSLIAD
jgi:GTP cyclohydrolase I